MIKTIFGTDFIFPDPDTEIAVTILMYTVIMANGTVSCNDLGGGWGSKLVVHVCPTPVV
ncbi:MAG: hypothetical protein ICV73_27420 [Acetobacteraceae bacterium]|nr:hypothetical protein [Acetobacteraceae bacterium]